MKRLIALALLGALLLTGCAGKPAKTETYTATFLTLFDTVTTIRGSAESKEAFTEMAQSIHDELETYHQLFDIYNDYEGIHNLKTVNDRAGKSPVEVDRKIIDLLKDCKAYYDLTGGKVNVAMGGVLKLWHEARNDGINDPANAYLPEEAALQAAAGHRDIHGVVIDEDTSTVYISDPEMRLDVGAVAKGWAVQRVAENAPQGLLISVGGNVCATGPKAESGASWVIGVQDPDSEEFLHTVYLNRGSVVTSGDYQRAYWVDGKSYHHIIDPETLYPATQWRSVSILCEDSGLADALSTALFLLDEESGRALLAKCDAEAMWVAANGEQLYTDGFRERIRT